MSAPTNSNGNSKSNPQMQRLVLVGGGHGHVQVIKALNRLSRPASVHVTLIDPQESASYSGMVPGCVSKLYTPDQTLIHLRPLAEWASIDYMKRSVVDVDAEKRKIFLNDVDDDAISCIEYDAVSFDIGSATRGLDETPGAAEYTIPTRPISDLVQRIADEEEVLKSELEDGSRKKENGAHVVVVGGGAAGIELSLAMRARWSYLFAGDDSKRNTLKVTLLDSGDELLPNETLPCRQALRKVLSDRNIDVQHQAQVQEITKDLITLENGQEISYSHIVWATGANRHPLADKLRERGIAISDRGWIRVGPTLQSVSHREIFAAGDCCTIEGLPDNKPSPPKAGVYAVRAGPILIENLTGYLEGKSQDALAKYNPQSDFLKLLMAGDGTALGFRFGLPLFGKWVWLLKDNIDVMFMDLFQAKNLPVLDESKRGDKLDTSQYDATEEKKPRLEPKEAAELLLRTDDDVDFRAAWSVLRNMMKDEEYKNNVLTYSKAIL
jgi:pyridine nucleotide-disulfide oxidoreductase family protein